MYLPPLPPSLLPVMYIFIYLQTIFPTFLLCAGFSASISKPPFARLCRRTLSLAGLGLVYNSVAALLSNRPIRFPGVLQRIAFSSFVNSIQPFYTWLFPFVCIGIWWWSSVTYYDPQCARAKGGGEGVEKWFSPAKCTAQTRIDYLVFKKEHMYSSDYDPEGLLSTFTTSAVTVCAGEHNCPTRTNSRDFNLNVSGPTAPQTLHLRNFQHAHTDPILFTPHDLIPPSNIPYPPPPFPPLPLLQTPLDASLPRPNRRHNPPLLDPRFRHRYVPFPQGDGVARNHGTEIARDLPCGGNITGVCDVSRETEGGRTVGMDGEGVGEVWLEKELELFGGKFGMGRLVCGIWGVFGFHGMEDKIMMCRIKVVNVWHFSEYDDGKSCISFNGAKRNQCKSSSI